MRSHALALFLSVCFTFSAARASAAPTETMAWSCTARDPASAICEGSLGVTIPLPSLQDEGGSLALDAMRGTALIVQTLARGTETGFRGTETGFVSLRDIAAGTETGFRYYLLVEWTCQVQMSLDGRARPGQARCDAPESRIVARRR